jgi:hypothetical protein
MGAKKGILWTLHLVVALVFQLRGFVIAGWGFFGLALCLPDRWEMWTAGFLVLLALETSAYMLLHGGPLDPKRLAGAGANFSK